MKPRFPHFVLNIFKTKMLKNRKVCVGNLGFLTLTLTLTLTLQKLLVYFNLKKKMKNKWI
jgi:hypothetical protein